MATKTAAKPANLKPGQLWGNLQKYGAKGAKFTVTVEKKVATSPNTYQYTFRLPDADLSLGAGPGQHVYLYAKIATKSKPKGTEVERIYCPVSPVDQLGSFDLCFKVYRKGTHPKYPEGGLMTQHLESLNVGDTIQIKGPLKAIHYPQAGTIQMLEMTPFRVNHIGMILGGTGITPVINILRAIANDKQDQTTVSLLYANNSEADILFKEELDQIAATCSKIKVTYIISKPQDANWSGLTGYVTKDQIKQLMPAPGKGVFMWVGGPPTMDTAVTKQLVELGYPKNRTMAGFYGYIFRLIFAAMCGCGK